MRKRLLIVLAGMLALGAAQVIAQTVQVRPEWAQGRSGGGGNRGDRQKRSHCPRVTCMRVLVHATLAGNGCASNRPGKSV